MVTRMTVKNSSRQELMGHIVSNINRAINENYIKVYYQPVIRTLTGEICGMEALARWEDPEYGLLSPDVFIEILEKEYMIHKLDSYMIRQICSDYAGIRKRGGQLVPISFNLSRLDFQLCDIHEVIEQAITKYELPLDIFRVEITESMMENNEKRMQDVIDRFWRRGLRVWMDDFGSGYSSLNVLKDYHFDTLKIDMLFLRSFDYRSREIIKSIVDMSKRIGVHTLAEGVETQEQLEFLCSIGCEKAQGYFIGKPMPFEQCMEHIKEKGYKLEAPNKKQYYHDIGAINILSATPMEGFSKEDLDKPFDKSKNTGQVPLAFVEYSGEDIHYIFSNEMYRDTLKSLNIESTDKVETLFEKGKSYFGVRFLSAIKKAINTKAVVTLNFTWENSHCLAHVKEVASYDGGSCLLCILYNITSNEHTESDSVLFEYAYSMFSLYDHIEVVDMETGYSKNVYISAQTVENYNILPAAQELRNYAHSEVHPDDRDRFIEFTDLSTMEKRLNESATPFLTSAFRILRPDGGYSWKLSTFLHVGNLSSKKIMACMRELNLSAMTGVIADLKEKGIIV